MSAIIDCLKQDMMILTSYQWIIGDTFFYRKRFYDVFFPTALHNLVRVVNHHPLGRYSYCLIEVKLVHTRRVVFNDAADDCKQCSQGGLLESLKHILPKCLRSKARTFVPSLRTAKSTSHGVFGVIYLCVQALLVRYLPR